MNYRLNMADQWSCYGCPEAWPQASGKVFLAQVVQLVGTAICEPWMDEVPLWMRNEVLPEVPPVYEAFDEEGLPVANVHNAYADAVRSIKSPATFAAERLTETEWIRSCVPDPEGGQPLPDLLLRARAGVDRHEPVTRAHWEEVSFLSAEAREQLHGAQSRMNLVARTLQTAMLEGRLQSYMRPIGGGIDGPAQIPAEWWEMDDPLPRLAWCGLNIATPLDPQALPTHWIFVDRTQLAEETAKLERVDFFDPDPPAPKPIGYSEQIIEEVTAFLTDAFETARPGMRKADFLKAAGAATGYAISETNWRAAWKVAVARHPERRKPGRPRTRKPLRAEMSPEI